VGALTLGRRRHTVPPAMEGSSRTPSEARSPHVSRVRSLFEARETIFVLELFYLAALLTAAATFIDGIFSLPGSLGTLPLAVPWFGALGAVLISLTGAATHAADWDGSTAYWHISRPLVGASVAIIGVLILQAGLTAVGSGPNSSGAVSTPSAPHNVLYYVVAFVLGYRERTFRQLLAGVVDVILSPGPTTVAQPTASALSPTSGPLAGGTSVVITGTGLAGTQSVRFGSKNAQFGVISDSQLNAVTPAGDAAGPVTVTITTQAATLSAPAFTYTP